MTDMEALALTTPTPLQRAIWRVIDGRPLGPLGFLPEVVEAFGGKLPEPGRPPNEIVIIGGVRGGKSLTTSGCSIRWSQRCDLSGIRDTEVPRVNVLSLDKDKASVVLNDHLIGSLTSGRLIGCLVERPPHGESVYLIHPSGRPIETKVMAGKRAGGSLVSRWCAGYIFDEAPRMVGDDEGVVNLEDSRKAVMGRMLPGAQGLMVGSPWAAYGPVYELYSKHWGNPTPDMVVVRAKGPLMNPVHWTEKLCEETRRKDPDTYRTDVEAEFLTPEENLFSHVAVDACTRKIERDIPPRDRIVYTAAMDPGTRGNAWTLVIAAQLDGVRTVVYARQWIGSTSSPLSPAVVLHEVATACHRYRITNVWTDQHSFDAIQDLAVIAGLSLSQLTWSESEKSQRYLSVRALFVDGNASIPPEPALIADLRRVQRKAVSSGVRIVLPETRDGRHCDFAPALVAALTNVSPEPAPAASQVDPAVLRMRKDAERRYGRRQ